MHKALYLVISVCLLLSFAQHDNMEGKTYYDEAKTKIKEVFSMQESMSFDPANPAQMVKTKYKQGPYFMYYESGKLQISGYFKRDQKNGTWKYYTEDGKQTKTEEYKNGSLQSSADH